MSEKVQAMSEEVLAQELLLRIAPQVTERVMREQYNGGRSYIAETIASLLVSSVEETMELYRARRGHLVKKEAP
jgi:hypothetical protein